MDDRRIAALDLLERLRRHEIESDTRQLGRLRADAAQLARQRSDLLDKLSTEARADDPALLGYVGDFIRSVRSEIDRVRQREARIEPELDKLETRVAEAFREIKTYEILRLDALAKRAEEARAKDDAEAEEIAIIRWQRRRSERARRIR